MLIEYKQNKQTPTKGAIFLIGLSHKLAKDGTVLDAFCPSTSSGKIIQKLENTFTGSNNIYKTNLVKGAPLDEQMKLRYPNSQEIEEGRDMLQKEISKYKPKAIVVFGNIVSKYILDKCESLPIITAQHPSYISTYKRKEIPFYIQQIINQIKHAQDHSQRT